MTRKRIIPILCLFPILALGTCGDEEDGVKKIAPGDSGYGPGTQDKAGADDLRGKYLMDDHDVTSEDCSDLTPENDTLAGKKFYLTIYQKGDELYAIAQSAEPGDDAKPAEMSGKASGNQFVLSVSQSSSQSGSQGGVSVSVSTSAKMTFSGTIDGSTISGTMNASISVTMSASGYGSKHMSCKIASKFSGKKVDSPKGTTTPPGDLPATDNPDAAAIPDVPAPPTDASDGASAAIPSALAPEPERPAFVLRPFRIHGIDVWFIGAH